MQPPEAEALGTRQLAESLQVDSLPSGFLADLALRFQDEGLEDMIKPAGKEAHPALEGPCCMCMILCLPFEKSGLAHPHPEIFPPSSPPTPSTLYHSHVMHMRIQDLSQGGNHKCAD